MISSFHIKRKRNCRDSYFSEVVREYPLRMQRTGGKNCNEVNEKGLVWAAFCHAKIFHITKTEKMKLSNRELDN